MKISEDLKKIIDEDIAMCKNIINNHNSTEIYNFHDRLISKYSNIITGFSENLISLYLDDDNHSDGKANIETMRQKLLLFKAMGYENMNEPSQTSTNINVSSNNINKNNLSVNITFDSAREQVENMSALTDKEIEEILAKISQLENIVNSKQRKSKKWENAKEIIKWIADKGVDVGLTLLPLLLKIGE